MSYTINKTDGTLLVDLIDGVLDTDTTDISLVGRNYSGYGEAFNENFIKLLENFSNTNQPSSPIRGQLWYDTSENKLKVFDGDTFQSAAGSFISESQPQGPIPGDTWFDSVGKQFYLFDGEQFQLIGPAYSEQQGESGIIVDTIDDTNLNKNTILKLVVDNSLQAVIASTTITPNQLPTNIIQGLVSETNPTGRIFPGINILETAKTNFKYRGIAESAEQILDAGGTPITSGEILQTGKANTVQEGFTISSSDGLTVGAQQNARLRLENESVLLTSSQTSWDMALQVNVPGTANVEDAIKIRTAQRRVGIFQSNPQYNLDVRGDLRITGNLYVEGDSITAQVETLTVEDKNIELGTVVNPTDITAAGGGIILKGDSDKEFIWVEQYASWTSSENIEISQGRNYRVGTAGNGVNVLNETTLGSTVINSNLENLGTLTELRVDETLIDNNTLSRSSGTGFTFSVGGDIVVSNSKITGLDEPSGDSHAVPLVTLNRSIQTEPIVFSIDTTEWTSVNDRIIDFLDVLYPPTQFANGKQARIACTNYGQQQTDPIDIATPTTTSTVEVNATAGGTVSVLQGINLPNSLTPNFNLDIVREIRVFEITNGVWTFSSLTSFDI